MVQKKSPDGGAKSRVESEEEIHKEYDLINDSTAICNICGSEAGWGLSDDEKANVQTVTIYCPKCGDLEYTHQLYYNPRR